ncbi:hypothetical protein F4824DRAFT_430997 [Ustulina deusta]|nr:hypothetical protein F4824DRAFT_430997 [Ustulina deusta]
MSAREKYQTRNQYSISQVGGTVRDLECNPSVNSNARSWFQLLVHSRCQRNGAFLGQPLFPGKLFHAATFDWKYKEIVVIGHGCRATHAVPIMSFCDGAAKRIT